LELCFISLFSYLKNNFIALPFAFVSVKLKSLPITSRTTFLPEITSAGCAKHFFLHAAATGKI
jgi:hypothetical protein